METTRSPRQQRSRETLHRILSSTVELLGERRFHELTVDDIVAHAGSSKGAFYSRFTDKESLLRHLNDQRFESALARWSDFLDPGCWSGRSVAEILEAFVARLVQVYRENRALTRAFVLHARYSGDVALTRKADRLNRHVLLLLQELVLERRDAIGRDDPESALHFGARTVAAAAREQVLFGDDAGDDAALATELTQMLLSYLRVNEAPER